MSKKSILWFSGLLSLIFVVSDYVGTYKLCGSYYTGNCPIILHNSFIFILPIIPIFILSLITYWMNENVFRAWIRLTYFWIPLSILVVILTPETTGSIFNIDKGFVSLVSSGLFVIISLLIIIISSIIYQPRSPQK